MELAEELEELFQKLAERPSADAEQAGRKVARFYFYAVQCIMAAERTAHADWLNHFRAVRVESIKVTAGPELETYANEAMFAAQAISKYAAALEIYKDSSGFADE